MGLTREGEKPQQYVIIGVSTTALSLSQALTKAWSGSDTGLGISQGLTEPPSVDRLLSGTIKVSALR